MNLPKSYFLKLALLQHRAGGFGQPVRLELTRMGQLALFANHDATRGVKSPKKSGTTPKQTTIF